MTEPTLEFRQKYINIGRQHAMDDARQDQIDLLEELAGQPDVELAVQKKIIALKGSAGTSAPSSLGPAAVRTSSTPARPAAPVTSAPRDLGDQVVAVLESRRSNLARPRVNP